MSELGNSEKKSGWGGPRPNSGRPKGSETEATKERRLVRKGIEKRILQHADSLLNSQLTLARGVNLLFVIEEKGEGKAKRRETRQVTKAWEIQEYIDSLADEAKAVEIEASGKYFYITTEKPDNKAIDSMLDRVFGRAVTSVEVKQVDEFSAGIRDASDDDIDRELARVEGEAAAAAQREAAARSIN